MNLPWLEPGDAFPDPSLAWDGSQPAPGLLAAGGALDAPTLLRAYATGIFPWFDRTQPILWWSPDPRMILVPGEFKLHRSLRKTLGKFITNVRCEVRMDSAFADVIRACAQTRQGQTGTWIVPQMKDAYQALHREGYAHSVETWIDGSLVGGLYCVSIGRAVFGESMFARSADASKIALAALVAFCRNCDIGVIDCQQNTRHLASLGAREIPRDVFLTLIERQKVRATPAWNFDPVYWRELMPPGHHA